MPDLYASAASYPERAKAWADTLNENEALACIGSIGHGLAGLALKLGTVPDLGQYTAAVNTAVVYGGLVEILARRINDLGMAADNTAIHDLNHFMGRLTDDINGAARRALGEDPPSPEVPC